MLTIGRRLTHDCQGPTRRALLQLGACSALGLALPDWLKSQAAGRTAAARVKSVLLLWMWGGIRGHGRVTCIRPTGKVSGEQRRGQTAGTLGAGHDPFRLEGFTFEDSVRVPELLARSPHLTAEQLAGRRSLLRRVDALQRRVE